MCSAVRQIDAINSIKTRRGAQYDKWIAGIIAGAKKHDGDLEIDDETLPPPPITEPDEAELEAGTLDLPPDLPPRRYRKSLTK